MNKWTFENKYMLLQAELHYLNQDYKAAGEAYLASIECANAHKFTHEEAMAYELFGVFCLENNRSEVGMECLHTAVERYQQWGASSKAANLERFIEGVDTSGRLARTSNHQAAVSKS